MHNIDPDALKLFLASIACIAPLAILAAVIILNRKVRNDVSRWYFGWVWKHFTGNDLKFNQRVIEVKVKGGPVDGAYVEMTFDDIVEFKNVLVYDETYKIIHVNSEPFLFHVPRKEVNHVN